MITQFAYQVLIRKNGSKWADLAGIGSWANGHGLDKPARETIKKARPGGSSVEDLVRRSPVGTKVLSRRLNEDGKVGPWSHLK